MGDSATNPADLSACPVVLATAAKWAAVTDAAPRPWPVVGEACLRTGSEPVRGCAGLVARPPERGAHISSERVVESLPVTPPRIAVGVAHRDQALAVRRALARLGARDAVAGTANRLQGRELDVTIVLHPLSGRRDATAFLLEAGRRYGRMR